MLESNFTDLDNDFITLWSNYILTEDYSIIKDDLEKLAELGQVNAIQSYYLFLKQGDTPNYIIENIVDGYRGDNFNHVLAKAHKAMFEEDYHSKYSDYIDLYNEYIDAYNDGNSRYFYLESQLEKASEDLSNTSSNKYQLSAENKCFKQFEKTLNPLYLERFGEIAATRDNIKLFKSFKRSLRGELKNLYKKNPNSPEIAYAYGKNLHFYSKSSKNLKKGNEMLTQLSKRPYSEALRNHIAGDSISNDSTYIYL